MVVELKYDPWKFKDLYETELGQALWEAVPRYENIIRMETAVDLKRTSVEALEYPLNEAFTDRFRAVIESDQQQQTKVFLRMKQMIGHMVGQIKQLRGFEKDLQGVILPKKKEPEGQPLKFTKATRFKRVKDS